MKRLFKKSLTLLLALTMVIGAAPLAGLVGIELPENNLFGMKAVAETYSGSCGDNLTWSLDTDTEKLVISGIGDMYNWDYDSLAPWYSMRSNIKTVIINDGVTRFGDWAFYNCTRLASVAISESVNEIGYMAFYGCTGLTSVAIQEGVTNIIDRAFDHCTGLTSVTIPDSVAYIGYMAFYNCTSLTSAYYNGTPDDLAKIDLGSGNSKLTNSIIFECKSPKPYYTGKCGDNIAYKLYTDGEFELSGTGKMYDWSSTSNAPWYNMRSYIKTVAIPNSITNIGNYAFYECDNLFSVNYSGTEIEWNAIDIGENNDTLSKASIQFLGVDPCFHRSEIIFTTPATCETDGESYRVCNMCREKFDVRVIVALGHDSNVEWTIDKEPTCTESGIKTQCCSRCATKFNATTIPALGHNAGYLEINKEATYVTPGEKVRKCTRCGATLEIVVIPKLEITMSIKNPSTTTIKCGDSIILHAELDKELPAGAFIVWTASNDNFDMSVSADGLTCKILPKSSGSTTFTAILCNEDWIAISTDSLQMTAKAGFFDKIIAFFKKIFGLTKTFPEAFKGIF